MDVLFYDFKLTNQLFVNFVNLNTTFPKLIKPLFIAEPSGSPKITAFVNLHF